MVATVGSIAVDLTVNGAKFEAGFKKAGTTVERESSRMAKAAAAAQRSLVGISGVFSSFGAGLAGGAAFAGLTSITGLLNSTREAVSKLDDIADRAKTSGLGTDLFQSMAITAKKAGVEINSLNGGLQTFAKNVGLAEQGTGRMFSQMEKLNPALLANILNAETQEERLKLVADALERTSDATERAALSQAAFGDVDFSRLLEGGGAALDAALKINKELDKIHSEDDIRQGAAYADALDDIADAIDKDLTGALKNLTPAIIGINKLFALGAEEVGKFATQIGELDSATKRFANDPSSKNLFEMLIGPDATEALGDFFGLSEKGFDELQVDLTETFARLKELQELGEQGFDIAIDTAKANAHLDVLLGKLAAINSAAQAAVPVSEATASKLPSVRRHGVGATVDEDGNLILGKGGVSTALPPGGGVYDPGLRASDRLPSDFGGGSQSLLEAMRYDIGFASGGMIHSGDTQPVSFFKSPDEAVGVFTPSQMDAIGNAMGGTTVNMGGITVNMPPGSDPMSPRSQLALLDAVERRVKQALSRP